MTDLPLDPEALEAEMRRHLPMGTLRLDPLYVGRVRADLTGTISRYLAAEPPGVALRRAFTEEDRTLLLWAIQVADNSCGYLPTDHTKLGLGRLRSALEGEDG